MESGEQVVEGMFREDEVIAAVVGTEGNNAGTCKIPLGLEEVLPDEEEAVNAGLVVARKSKPELEYKDDEDEEEDDDEVYEVESILQERTRRFVKEYFVRWKGYGLNNLFFCRPLLVIKCKTIFKKHLIQNCLKCEDRREPDDDDSPDAVVKYFMRYDIDSGLFFVGDVEVEVDEVRKCIKCNACGKVFGGLTIEQKLIPGKTPLQFWQMVREMKLHIIGRHLGGFTCYLCDEPYVFHTRGATHFYRHMSLFHKADRQQTEGEPKQNQMEEKKDGNEDDDDDDDDNDSEPKENQAVNGEEVAAENS